MIFILLQRLAAAILLYGTMCNGPVARPQPGHYTERQVQCLAANIYHEARGEGYLGGLAIAVVVINRTQHVDYPRDICAVVYQRSQFSWTKHSAAKTTPGSIYLARVALSRAHELGKFQATHYHQEDIRPSWRLQLKREASIGQHIFYR